MAVKRTYALSLTVSKRAAATPFNQAEWRARERARHDAPPTETNILFRCC